MGMNQGAGGSNKFETTMMKKKKAFATLETSCFSLMHHRPGCHQDLRQCSVFVRFVLSLDLVLGNFICALNTQAKLRYSMVLTRIEIEREKLEMKLDGILQSQMKLLKTWRSMKRQYVAAITLLQECLYSVACRVHLLEGAQVDLKLALVSQKRALKLTDSMNSSLSAFLPLADEIAGLLSELAEVVVQEKFLLQEFNDMFHTMCLLQHRTYD
ncbi:QWRF motif-containing protein [Vigna angularis]|uniref:QWRF motif-containing protein n=1 Tax=Phaseolus angularis TaxID=3914 RepID=A0A8T0KJ99_PHAAN|nr:QWRF motif-containing protein [Vigna angularis]